MRIASKHSEGIGHPGRVSHRAPGQGRGRRPAGVPAVPEPSPDDRRRNGVPRRPRSPSPPHAGAGRRRGRAPRVPERHPDLEPGAPIDAAPRGRVPRSRPVLRVSRDLSRAGLSEDREPRDGSRTRNRDAVRPRGRGPDAGGDGPVPISERGRDELEGLGRSVPGLPSAGDLEWTGPSKVRTTPDERRGATTPRSPYGSDAPHLRRESDSRKTSRMDPRGPAAAPPHGGRHRRRIQGGALRRPVLSRTPGHLRGRRRQRPLHRRGALGPRAIVSGRVGRLRLPVPLGRLSQRGHRGDGRRPSVGGLRHRRPPRDHRVRTDRVTRGEPRVDGPTDRRVGGRPEAAAGDRLSSAGLRLRTVLGRGRRPGPPRVVSFPRFGMRGDGREFGEPSNSGERLTFQRDGGTAPSRPRTSSLRLGLCGRDSSRISRFEKLRRTRATKIAVAAPEYGRIWGGIGTYVSQLLHGLGPHHEVTILGGKEARSSIPNVTTVPMTNGGSVMTNYLKFQLALRRRLPDLIREYRPDLFIVHHAQMPDLLTSGVDCPIVVTTHTTILGQSRGIQQARRRGSPLDESEKTTLTVLPALLPAEVYYWKRVRHALFVSNAVRNEVMGAYEPRLRTAATVASNVPGVTDMVSDGKSALLVPPGDPHALAGALQRILSDESLARRLGAAAGQQARDRFSLDRMSNETLRYFEQVLAAS